MTGGESGELAGGRRRAHKKASAPTPETITGAGQAVLGGGAAARIFRRPPVLVAAGATLAALRPSLGGALLKGLFSN